jgi:hypothetical protein
MPLALMPEDGVTSMTRSRKMVKFWLDMKHADQQEISVIVEDLRQRRQLARTIRDGIRLVCDLRAGKIDVLMELFPWVKDALQPDRVISTENRLQEQIARLEGLLLAQGNVPIQLPGTVPLPKTAVQATPKALIEQNRLGSKASAETVAKNFLSSMKGIASGLFD